MLFIAESIPKKIRALLKQGQTGVANWNEWREEHPKIKPDLSSEDLSFAELQGVNFKQVNLSNSNFHKANLHAADMWNSYASGADFSFADLSVSRPVWSYLSWCKFEGADLRRACFKETDLSFSNFEGANLTEADLAATYLRGSRFVKATLSKAILEHAVLIGSDLSDAILSDAYVYGTSVWKLEGIPIDQKNLVITPQGENDIMVDNINIAQFIYLLLKNTEIKSVIDTITTKAVLILGRFSPERKIILDELRDILRRKGYLPIIFDFVKSSSRNLTETISTLAHLAYFVIADITEAKSIPQELQRIVPDLPSVPIQPLLLSSQPEYPMFQDFLDYPWVLTPHLYDHQDDLLSSLDSIIVNAELKAKEIKEKRMAFEMRLSKN